MNTPIEGEPAFPNGPHGMSIHFDDGRVDHQYPGSQGMTLRQWYIGKALQGLCANPDLTQSKAELIGELSIYQADAVMQLLYPQQKETN